MSCAITRSFANEHLLSVVALCWRVAGGECARGGEQIQNGAKSMIDELVTGLVEREQAVLRELVRLAELNTAQALAEPAFHTASMSIRAQLRAHAAKVEELELLASEQDRASDVEQAMRHVSRHRSEGATLQASLRDLGGKVSRHAHAHVSMFMHMRMTSWCTLKPRA